MQTEHKEGVVETNEEETEEESPVSEVIAAPVPAEDQNYEAPDRNSENQLSVTDQELQTVSSETATGSVENDRDTDRNTERSTRVKVNDNIRYKLGDEWVNGTIISRAGKASGKYKNWYNVRNENNDERSIDLERHEWQKIPETEINITETSSNKSLDSSEINIAKENELEKLAQFETYEEVADCGQKVLSTRWVITNKDGKTKARLVVREFGYPYSSHQLIFGKNPNLPGIMTDGLPGLEGSTSSEIFAKHLNALHSSRRAYIETEANERIRRALRGKIRAAEDIFEKGDTVYYKREGKERWLGPATVVFQEGKVVFVRHGGIVVMSTIVVIKLSVTSRKYFLVFNNGSRARFRSSDLWVMGPARFHCAILDSACSSTVCDYILEGEFNADEMREVMSILNVRVLTTAAESPFQNGLCERVHAVTDMMLLKLEEENKRTDSQTLLCWANMARNALQMWNGYSSHQLIFGKNPNLPGIMTDGLPGLEGSTSSEIFAKHLNALHSSRRAYIETEANERIRRALRGKIRAAEDIFEKGEKVKRDGLGQLR